MQTILISNKLKQQIKMKFAKFEIVKIKNVTKIIDNNNSNEKISIKLNTFEFFSKVFIFEKKFDFVKKIHD